MGSCGLEPFCLHRTSRHHPGQVVAELAPLWLARRESALRQRRGRDQLPAEGAERRQVLVFPDRVLLTVAVLRLQVPHAALAVMYGVDRSTLTRAVREIRPLLARRGYATPAGPRLHTLADVFAYAAAHGIALRADGSEVQVRRPKAGRPGRRAFVWSQPTGWGQGFTPTIGGHTSSADSTYQGSEYNISLLRSSQPEDSPSPAYEDVPADPRSISSRPSQARMALTTRSGTCAGEAGTSSASSPTTCSPTSPRNPHLR